MECTLDPVAQDLDSCSAHRQLPAAKSETPCFVAIKKSVATRWLLTAHLAQFVRRLLKSPAGGPCLY